MENNLDNKLYSNYRVDFGFFKLLLNFFASFVLGFFSPQLQKKRATSLPVSKVVAASVANG